MLFRSVDGKVSGQRVISAKTAQAIREMLQMAAGPGGTAPKAMTMGYSVGGKSGTAYKQEGKGYATKSTARGSSASPPSATRASSSR